MMRDRTRELSNGAPAGDRTVHYSFHKLRVRRQFRRRVAFPVGVSASHTWARFNSCKRLMHAPLNVTSF
jgi:hypothetical protein